MSLMNTHRRDPRAEDAADEEEDVEDDDEERDEAVTGGAASSRAAPPGAGPRSGAGTSALISLNRGDAPRSGDMDRARRCTDALRGVRSRPRAGARPPPPSSSSSLLGSRSGSGGRVSGRIWPLWKSSSAEIMGPPGPPNSNSASPAHPRPPAPAAAEAEDDVEKRRWWMGLAGALKKYPPPTKAGERPGLDGALANGVEQELSMSSSMAPAPADAAWRVVLLAPG